MTKYIRINKSNKKCSLLWSVNKFVKHTQRQEIKINCIKRKNNNKKQNNI